MKKYLKVIIEAEYDIADFEAFSVIEEAIEKLREGGSAELMDMSIRTVGTKESK